MLPRPLDVLIVLRYAMRPRLALPLRFYRRPAETVARDLIGRTLARRIAPRSIRRGTIVEVEVYDGPRDRASHAFRGRTARNASMFEAGGIAYVYLVYGMHWCLNLVTGESERPSAILLRAATEPVPGENASGPGRLGRAFAIDRSLDGARLVGPDLWVEPGDPPAASSIGRSTRIGVDYAGAWASRRLRFGWKGHGALSRRL